jgi:fructokinase
MSSVARRRIGIDLGGTKIEAVVLDETNAVVLRERLPTEAEQGYEHIIDQIHTLVQRCLMVVPGATAVGMGTPGAVSSRTGAMKNCNTTCLNGRFLWQDLEARLQMAVSMENDANLFALAEAHAGAGRGYDVVFGVIMGTGVGGGIVFDGKLHRGRQSLAGEWGHHCLDPAGPRCYCGQVGCAEMFLAGPVLERQYRARRGGDVTTAQLVSAYRQGETVAVEIMEEFFRHFGRAVANVIAILDPDIIVLGGGLSNIEELYPRGREAVGKVMFNDELRTPIVPNQLGDSAGVIGAALLV